MHNFTEDSSPDAAAVYNRSALVAVSSHDIAPLIADASSSKSMSLLVRALKTSNTVGPSEPLAKKLAPL
jgi:hypothetical protein